LAGMVFPDFVHGPDFLVVEIQYRKPVQVAGLRGRSDFFWVLRNRASARR
jgi:hypothetical protein